MTATERGRRADDDAQGWTCLCRFPSGEEGVYVVQGDQLLRGARTSVAGLDGVWIITEMSAPDEAEVIDLEIWLRPADATTGEDG